MRAVLQEDGLTQFAEATYTQPGGQKLSIHAFRFGDATGAYSAFTFYRQPGMHPAQVGDTKATAGADGPHVLFRSGVTLVDATFSQPDASPAALAPLVAALPRAGGPSAIPPPLPTYPAARRRSWE